MPANPQTAAGVGRALGLRASVFVLACAAPAEDEAPDTSADAVLELSDGAYAFSALSPGDELSVHRGFQGQTHAWLDVRARNVGSPVALVLEIESDDSEARTLCRSSYPEIELVNEDGW